MAKQAEGHAHDHGIMPTHQSRKCGFVALFDKTTE
jgi:hypothetical protein